MTAWPAPSLRHLARLTDENGIVEHADHDRPRRDLGYCTDDAGRLLALAARLPADPDAHRLATVALGFLTNAHLESGHFRLRLGTDGAWTDDPPSDDASGRALFGLGTAAVHAHWPEVRSAARSLFEQASGFRSAHPRAIGHAVLGATEVLRIAPHHPGAHRLLSDAADLLVAPSANPRWPWPEPRLTYANALLPEALLAAGYALQRWRLVGDALGLLEWLVDHETRHGRFSFTPVGGRAPGSRQPAFDQQPIEAWAMAEACHRAYRWSREPRWAEATERAAAWFLGANDTGVAVFDPSTGGGYDGLEPDGVNRNQGAESSLAFVATMRTVHAVGLLPSQAARVSPALVRASRR